MSLNAGNTPLRYKTERFLKSFDVYTAKLGRWVRSNGQRVPDQLDRIKDLAVETKANSGKTLGQAIQSVTMNQSFIVVLRLQRAIFVRVT